MNGRCNRVSLGTGRHPGGLRRLIKTGNMLTLWREWLHSVAVRLCSILLSLVTLVGGELGARGLRQQESFMILLVEVPRRGRSSMSIVRFDSSS